jgi:hypothetical protein
MYRASGTLSEQIRFDVVDLPDRHVTAVGS